MVFYVFISHTLGRYVIVAFPGHTHIFSQHTLYYRVDILSHSGLEGIESFSRKKNTAYHMMSRLGVK